jgi:hypothetical protein
MYIHTYIPTYILDRMRSGLELPGYIYLRDTMRLDRSASVEWYSTYFFWFGWGRRTGLGISTRGYFWRLGDLAGEVRGVLSRGVRGLNG